MLRYYRLKKAVLLFRRRFLGKIMDPNGVREPQVARPLLLRRVYTPKGADKAKLRPLGISVVRDRVAQEVIRRLLAPVSVANLAC